MGVVVHHKTANVAVEEVSNSSSIMLRFLKADGLKIFLDPTMFYFSLKAFSYVFYSMDSIIRLGCLKKEVRGDFNIHGTKSKICNKILSNLPISKSSYIFPIKFCTGCLL